MRYCLLPVVSSPPCPVVWRDGLLPLSFDDPVSLRSNTVRLGRDDRLTLLITQRPANAMTSAINIEGSVTTKAPRKLAKAAKHKLCLAAGRLL
jgi:hypothetical protein